MPGLQDLSVRLAELLDIPETEALRITSRFVPVITLESIVGLPSTRVPGLVGSPAVGTIFQTGVAAENSHLQLFNPVNSGVLVFVDQMSIRALTDGSLILARHDTALGTLGTNKGFRDFRKSGSPVAELRSGTNVGVLGTTLIDIGASSAADTTKWDLSDLVLDEGQGIVGVNSNLNEIVNGWWLWREV